MNIRIQQLCPIFILVLFSCHGGNDFRTADVSDIKIETIKIGRYEQALFNIDKSNLKSELEKLQPQFPMFLDGDLNDSANLKRICDYISDTMLASVYTDCNQTFPDLTDFEAKLTEAFRYVKYYYPEKKLPDVFSYVSGFDYEYPVQYFDDHLIIAIDMYLGTDYPRYKKLGLANYILRRFSKEYIIRDCIFALAQAETDRRQMGSALLEMMIAEGKKLWFAQAMIPDLPEAILLDYTAAQLEWLKRGEGSVWAFLIENEMLYSAEMQTIQKFISDGPFTSYFGAGSPPRLGAFIGFKIVSSYMNRHSNVTAGELMGNYHAQDILNRSGYKPKF